MQDHCSSLSLATQRACGQTTTAGKQAKQQVRERCKLADNRFRRIKEAEEDRDTGWDRNCISCDLPRGCCGSRRDLINGIFRGILIVTCCGLLVISRMEHSSDSMCPDVALSHSHTSKPHQNSLFLISLITVLASLAIWGRKWRNCEAKHFCYFLN